MNKIHLSLIAYSALLVIGGLIGFLVAGSMVSLIMSSSFALLLLLSLYLKDQYPVIGDKMTYGILTILSAFFIFRAIQTGKLMPSGLLALLSIGMIALILISNRNSYSKT